MKLTIEKRGAPRGAKPILEVDTDEPVKVGGGKAPRLPEQRDESAERNTAIDWARAKGHVPSKERGPFRGSAVHKGPHYAVVLRHMCWPANLMVTEGEYDAAAESAYAVGCAENLGEQLAAKMAADERAAAQRQKREKSPPPGGEMVPLVTSGEEG